MPKVESFLIPIKVHLDVTTSCTTLDVKLEKQSLKITGTSNGEKEIVRCMDRIHKICPTKGKATGRIFMVRAETYEETSNFSSRQCMARYVEIYV